MLEIKPHGKVEEVIIREWMEKNTYLPVHNVDEDSEVGGSA